MQFYEPLVNKHITADFFNVRSEVRGALIILASTLGTLCLVSFGGFAIYNQNYFLGGLLLCLGLLTCFGLCLALTKASERAIQFICTLIPFSLIGLMIFTGGYENTGLLWIYPTLIIGILVNPFVVGLTLCVYCVVLSFVMLFTPLSQYLSAEYSLAETTRYMITLVITALGGLLAVFFDERAVKHMRSLHQNLVNMASFDPLTGLANRRNFRCWLKRLLMQHRPNDKCTALLHIDLDNFKGVNDTFGHSVGDRLLSVFAHRLYDSIRTSNVSARLEVDSMSRLAGDEFAFVLTDVSASYQVEIVAKRILSLFEGGFEIEGQCYPISASIGVALYPTDADRFDTLIDLADSAMHQAKHDGKNGYCFFTPEIGCAISERRGIEDGLREALHRQQFSLVYMPMYCCKTQILKGVEVLIRSSAPRLAKSGPDKFIPVAEQMGLIKQVDQWVIEQAFSRLRSLQVTYGFNGLFCINISALELQNPKFAKQVSDLLTKYHIVPSSVELEITETSLIVNDDNSIRVLEELKALGVSLALDDFGTGYTAFNQLGNYPVDCLKIDRSFVNDLFSEQQPKQRMVSIIQNLAKLHDLRVIAEGVETEAQLQYLQKNGCDWVQGYHLSKPMPWSEFIDLVTTDADLSQSLNVELQT